MYMDEVVVAGVLTVGLMVVFLGGFAWFAWRDSQKQNRKG